MKIVCTKEECSDIIRACCNAAFDEACIGCVFKDFYEKPCAGIENVMNVEIVPSERSGENNG